MEWAAGAKVEDRQLSRRTHQYKTELADFITDVSCWFGSLPNLNQLAKV